MTNATITPFFDRVLLRRIPNDTVSQGGIHIPDVAVDQAQICEVLTFGPGRMLDSGVFLPCPVAKGDTVYVSKYAGSEITVTGHTYLVVRQDEIIGKVVYSESD